MDQDLVSPRRDLHGSVMMETVQLGAVTAG